MGFLPVSVCNPGMETAVRDLGKHRSQWVPGVGRELLSCSG